MGARKLRQVDGDVFNNSMSRGVVSNYSKEASFAAFSRPSIKTYMDLAYSLSKLLHDLGLHIPIQPHHKPINAVVAHLQRLLRLWVCKLYYRSKRWVFKLPQRYIVVDKLANSRQPKRLYVEVSNLVGDSLTNPYASARQHYKRSLTRWQRNRHLARSGNTVFLEQMSRCQARRLCRLHHARIKPLV
jgi:hypothetical protein